MRGSNSFLAVKSQSDLFTGKALASLVARDYLAFNREGLSGSTRTIDSPAIRRQAMRSSAFSALGTIDAGGDLEFTASNLTLDTLLPLIMPAKTGSADVLGTDGEGGATYKLVDAAGEPADLTPFTVFVGLEEGTRAYTRQFIGAKVDSASFAARVDDKLRLTLNVAAVEKAILDGSHDPLDSGLLEYAFIFDQAKVELKSGSMASLAEIPVESFDLSVAHNLERNAYRLGSRKRRSLEQGITSVTGSFTVDAAMKALAGANLDLAGGAADDPAFLEKIALEARYVSLKLTFTDPNNTVTYTLADGVTTAERASQIVLDIPMARLEEPDFQVRDEGLLTGSARFTAYDSFEINHICDLTTAA